MRILAANLRHLYQKKYSSYYAMLVAMPPLVFMMGMLDDGRGGFVAMAAIAMLSVGVILASLPLDVLGRPFSYGLPGHRKVPRRFLLITGIVACLVEATIVYVVGRTGFETGVITFVSLFFAGSVFYWLGVRLVFQVPMMGVSFAALPLFVGMSFFFWGGEKFCDNLILNQHFIVIPAGIAAYVLAWHYWGKEDLPRRHCGTAFIMMPGDRMSAERQVQMNRAIEEKKKDKRKSSSLIKPEVEAFFTGKIAAARPGSLASYVWGQFYESFGILLSRGYIIFLVMILFLVCFVGYIGGGVLGAFIPMLMWFPAFFTVRSVVPTMIGRRERFWTGISISVVVSILSCVFFLLLILLSIGLKSIMPSLTIAGHVLTYQLIDFGFMILPLPILPVLFLIGVVNREQANRQICVCLPFLAAAILSVFLFPFYHSTEMLLLQTFILCLLGWACFVAVLRYTFLRCDLSHKG